MEECTYEPLRNFEDKSLISDYWEMKKKKRKRPKSSSKAAISPGKCKYFSNCGEMVNKSKQGLCDGCLNEQSAQRREYRRLAALRKGTGKAGLSPSSSIGKGKVVKREPESESEEEEEEEEGPAKNRKTTSKRRESTGSEKKKAQNSVRKRQSEPAVNEEEMENGSEDERLAAVAAAAMLDSDSDSGVATGTDDS